MSSEQFIYTDMHRSDVNGTHFPWKRVRIDQVNSIVKTYVDKGFNLYTTIQKFDSAEHIDPEPEYCNLGFDFDCAADVCMALTEAKVCANYFIKVHGLGVSPEEVMVYFSGNRGFHVTVNAGVFQADPKIEMIKVWRILVNTLNKEWGSKTLDVSVYTKRRAWRIPNTKHTKTGLYKRALTYDELNSSLDNIKELAKEPCSWIDIQEVI